MAEDGNGKGKHQVIVRAFAGIEGRVSGIRVLNPELLQLTGQDCRIEWWAEVARV